MTADEAKKEVCFHCRYFWQDKWERNDPCAPGQCHRNPPAVMPMSRRLGHAWSWFPFVKSTWTCGEFREKEVVEV